MTPEVDMLMLLSAGKLTQEIAPQLPAGHTQGSVATIGMVMVLAAQEYGRAADVRSWENARMREILARAGVEAVASSGTLTIAALNEENAQLAKSLIALHEAVEIQTEGDGPALNREILSFLKESAARNRLYLPPM